MDSACGFRLPNDESDLILSIQEGSDHLCQSASILEILDLRDLLGLEHSVQTSRGETGFQLSLKEGKALLLGMTRQEPLVAVSQQDAARRFLPEERQEAVQKILAGFLVIVIPADQLGWPDCCRRNGRD